MSARRDLRTTLVHLAHALADVLERPVRALDADAVAPRSHRRTPRVEPVNDVDRAFARRELVEMGLAPPAPRAGGRR